MLYLILVGFAAASVAPFLYRHTKPYFGWIAGSFPLYLFFRFLLKYQSVASGQVLRETHTWLPSQNIHLSFLLDGLSLTFVLIITLIGAVVFLYAGAYMKHYAQTGRFYLYIGVFMTAMIGLVLSDNLITLFIFWELTSISSYLLIGFNHHQEGARKSALQALLVTGAGGLAMLAGLILLSQVSGVMEISALKGLVGTIQVSRSYPAIVILVLFGAFTKSAQFPFHFWLPNAMAAPTPVSAYLHSATMVKAGIYLIARLNPYLGGTLLWQDTLLFFGAVTMVIAAILSFKQTDLKRLLAYSTLVVLGTLTMLLGIGSKLAIKAVFIFLVAHSLYKGTLFLVAGTLDHETGTRDVSRLGGLRHLLPITAVTAILASLSKMGIIPLVGFIGKETVYSAILELEKLGNFLIIAAVCANAFVVWITLQVGFKPFFGTQLPTPKSPHEAPIKMWAGPLLLALLGLLIGIFPNFFIGKLLDHSATSMLAEKLGLKIKLWHGFNRVLLLSLVTVGLGALLYIFRARILARMQSIRPIALLQPSVWYEMSLRAMLSVARTQTQILQNGYLRYYIIFIILTTLGLTVTALMASAGLPAVVLDFKLAPYEIVLGLVIIAATVIVLKSNSRLVSIVALGMIGYGIAVIYIINSAPDLAMTTFAVETLTVVVFILVLYRLPRFTRFSRTGSKIRDLVIAGAVGMLMTLIIIFVTATPLQSDLKQYYGASSYLLAHGRNIVNVILVDFRALDTLGEITVLGVAALGVFALLKLVPGKGER